MKFADLKEADLSGAILRDAALVHADLAGASMKNSVIEGANFKHTIVTGALIGPGWKLPELQEWVNRGASIAGEEKAAIFDADLIAFAFLFEIPVRTFSPEQAGRLKEHLDKNIYGGIFDLVPGDIFVEVDFTVTEIEDADIFYWRSVVNVNIPDSRRLEVFPGIYNIIIEFLEKSGYIANQNVRRIDSCRKGIALRVPIRKQAAPLASSFSRQIVRRIVSDGDLCVSNPQALVRDGALALKLYFPPDPDEMEEIELDNRKVLWQNEGGIETYLVKDGPDDLPAIPVTELEVAQAEEIERLKQEIEELRKDLRELRGKPRAPEVTVEELAQIPLYPGRGTDSMTWYEEHWAPLVQAGRVWQHHVREHDERLFNAVKSRLRDHNTSIWQLIPPEPGRAGRAVRRKRKQSK